VHAFAPDGRLELIGKFVQDLPGKVRLAHEFGVLQVLSRMRALRGNVPTPITFLQGHIGDTLVTNALDGRPAAPKLSSTLRRWLEACRVGGTIEVGKCELVRRAAPGLTDAPRNRLVNEGVEAARTYLSPVEVPVTIVHGDFAPWNILFSNGSPQVFDWEYACVEGIPGWDEATFALQVGLVTRRWSAGELGRGAEKIARELRAPYGIRARRALVLLVMADLASRGRNGRIELGSVISNAIATLVSAGWLDADG
jgi:hypothetical protein